MPIQTPAFRASFAVAILVVAASSSFAQQQTKTTPDTTKKTAAPPSKTSSPASKTTLPQTKTSTPQTKTSAPQTKAATPAPKTAPPPTTTGKTAAPPAGKTAAPQTTAGKTAAPPAGKTAAPQATAGKTAAPPTPPAGKTTPPPAGQNKTNPPAGRGGAAAQTPARPDTGAVAPVVLMREVYDYPGNGRRDPFRPLTTTTDLRPTMADLKVLMTVVDEPGRSVALLNDSYNRKQHTVRVGTRLGRMRVASIRQNAVVFTIEEFGMNRRDSLVLRDTTKVRGR